MIDWIIDEAAQLDEASVFADELLARGDPRGELLALELASVRAATPEQARELNERARELATESQFWPSSFAPALAKMRAGFVVDYSGAAEGQLKACAPMPALRGLWKLEGSRMDELEHEFARVNPACVSTTLDRTTADWDDLGVLMKLRRLVHLKLQVHGGVHLDAALEQLLTLPQLRGLTLPHHTQPGLEQLRGAPLTHLQLGSLLIRELPALAELPQLRHLHAWFRTAEALGTLTKLRLDSLSLQLDAGPQEWAEVLSELSLRHLQVEPMGIRAAPVMRWREAHAQLDDRLESLEVPLRHLDVADTFAWPALRRLVLWGEGPVEALPRLEHLGLSATTLASLRELPSPSLAVLDEGLDIVDWQHLASIQRAVPLRVLDLRLLGLEPEPPDAALRALEQLEHLLLPEVPNSAQVKLLEQLPCLRRLTVTDMRPGHHRELRGRLREVLVESTPHWPRIPAAASTS